MDDLRFVIQSQLGKRMLTASMLVETVSIDYEDFNESFLTCSTCLCTYDGEEHIPKLLHCSHTVCRSCLEKIASGANVRDTGTFRCPICRETIPLPRGGVGALPPSFLVNQLLDLFQRQRREVVPKCSSHTSQELLFCESCDCVFCTACTQGTHGTGSNSCDHTVIPFSIAIKRMSEILLYKAHLCINKLNSAAENVNDEIRKLNKNVDYTFEVINTSFQELVNLVENRRQEVLALSKKIKDEKTRVLQEQLALIEAEKNKVEQDCNGLQYQVEVRNITKKINDLNEKIDSVNILLEPRENGFIRYDYQLNNSFSDIKNTLSSYGLVRSSTTFPPLCTVEIENVSANLQSSAIIRTVDYHGCFQTTGGDPVTAEIKNEKNKLINSKIVDKDNGTYHVLFTPDSSGIYSISVNVFGRPIKDSPFSFDVTEHINPITKMGTRGSNDSQFLQPVGIAFSKQNQVFILDTGNSRIKALSPSFEFSHHIYEGLENRGGTGIAVSPSDTLLVVNWRTKQVTEMNFDGVKLGCFSHQGFVEPIDIAVNNKGEIFVADSGANVIFMFEPCGKLLKTIGSKGQLGQITAVCIGSNNEILVSGSQIHIFSYKGDLLRVIFPEGKGRGRYGGLAYDSKGTLLATRIDKNGNNIQVFNYSSGQLKFVIDSYSNKLKRPSGLAVSSDSQLLVADLGNDCIKRYHYI